MRLLWLSHFIPYPPRGGALQRSHNLLRLAAAQNEVHLVALNQRALLPTDESIEEAVEALRPWVASISVHPIPTDGSRFQWGGLVATNFFRPGPYSTAWLRQPTVAKAVNQILATQSIELIHVDTIGLWPYVATVREPIALNHHNVESQMMDRRAERDFHPFRRVYFRREAAKLRRLESAACPRAEVNLVVSALDGERLRSIIPTAAVAVVENGVDASFFKPDRAVTPKPGSLFFAATMSWYPNAEAVRYLVGSIWPRLLEVVPEATLTLGGGGPPAEAVAAARADDRIRLTGQVADIRPYFDQAEVYVCPIRDGGGTKLKVLDALAMAKPIVATGLSVEGIDVVDGEHYLRAETAEDFVRQVARLRGDPALRERLGRNGRTVAETKYSWDVIGGRMQEIYRDAVSVRRSDSSTVAA